MTTEPKPVMPMVTTIATMASLAGVLVMLLQGGQIVGGLRAEIAQQAAGIEDIETRLRGQEQMVTRNDEKTANILTLLARIDARLERIERNCNGYPQP